MGKAIAAAEKIFRIIEHPSAINAIDIDKDTTKKLIPNTEDIIGKIEFRDVWFRYPTRKEDFVLRGLSITINPKEQVALVGESGCGKSTFVNLLMRFYDVDFGEILLDGVNIKDYNLHDLRKAISLVMQEPIIFNYSIMENILYGKLDASNTEIQDAAVISNAIEFIETDSNKLDETAAGLLKEMIKNKDTIVKLIGEKKFEEEIEILKKCEAAESKKGKFQAI
jgi:ATP-binding cassette subfamily B (MDR/TAP) protein 1